MQARRTVYTFITAAFFLISSLLLLMYIYDPLQLFHKHWIGNKKVLSNDMRRQVAGLLNSFEYDSIILGTSMLANTSSDEASTVLGGKFINISFPGSDFYERSFVLEYALAKKNIQRVIYSLDDIGLVDARKKPSESIIYLYDDNRVNDFKAYFNKKYLQCLLTFSTSKKCRGRVKELDRPSSWYLNENHKNRFGGLDNWFKAKNSAQVQKAFENILDISTKIENGELAKPFNAEAKSKKVKRYLDKYILHSVKNHNETEFIFIIPPYSRLNYAMKAQYFKQDFEIYMKMIRYLVLESESYGNMHIYAWGNNTFVDEIKNYKDPSHYHYHFNSWMLYEIKAHRGELSEDNIGNYLNLFKEKALNYEFRDISNKIKHYQLESKQN